MPGFFMAGAPVESCGGLIAARFVRITHVTYSVALGVASGHR